MRRSWLLVVYVAAHATGCSAKDVASTLESGAADADKSIADGSDAVADNQVVVPEDRASESGFDTLDGYGNSPEDSPSLREGDEADAIQRDAAAGCSCEPGDTARVLRTSLDCLCGLISIGCPENLDAVRRSERPGLCPTRLPDFNAHTTVIRTYADCGVIVVSRFALDAPTLSWIFDIDGTRLLGLTYQPGLSDGYASQICTDGGPLQQTVQAGIDLPACALTNTEQLCPPPDAGVGPLDAQ